MVNRKKQKDEALEMERERERVYGFGVWVWKCDKSAGVIYNGRGIEKGQGVLV